MSVVKDLHSEIALLKAGQKSDTSSTPSSHDYGRINKYNSRIKTTNKSGGQVGHKGSTLKMSSKPDKTINYTPKYCKSCGNSLVNSAEKLIRKRQEIVLPPIEPQYVEHRSYECSCSNCGVSTTSEMPIHLTANIQYGTDIQSLVTYLSVYQLLPAKRLQQFLKDFAGIKMSQGTIFNILASMSKKAQPTYEIIKEQLESAKWLGGDETGFHVNKSKAWFWIFQNDKLTYIKASATRGYQTIIDTFEDGFPNSVYVTDSLAAQLKVNSLAKQLCLAHLSRELKKFEEVFDSDWASQMKKLFKETIDFKKEILPIEYPLINAKVVEFEDELSQILALDFTKNHKKEKAFINRLKKMRDAVFTFLYYEDVPPDNNGSERGIRNIKVKMKISNQFVSFIFAQHFAVIRSVIDTTIKNGMEVFHALNNLALQEVRPAE